MLAENDTGVEVPDNINEVRDRYIVISKLCACIL